VTPGHRAFFYSPFPAPGTKLDFYKPQLDAMWAEFDLGIPTINGYSGKLAPNWWPICEVNIASRPKMEKRLAGWLEEHDLPEDSVAVICPQLTEPPVLSTTVRIRDGIQHR